MPNMEDDYTQKDYITDALRKLEEITRLLDGAIIRLRQALNHDENR